MDPNRWKAVNEIFHAALELPPGEREGFVDTAVGGDHDLRAEVDLLLQADADAGSYMESPWAGVGLMRGMAPPAGPGDLLCSRFRIVRQVAEGGMGHVLEALDTELGVRVALKVIRPEISSDPEALARFRQEVRLARSITHPNVCRTFDLERETSVDSISGVSRDLVFLTMEFLEGETLAARIERGGALPIDEAGEIARQIAGALQAAHSLGIVHRDMKPANVMLVPEAADEGGGYRVVITDFGLARRDPLFASGSASAISRTTQPIGTLAYMAPEQIQGAAISAATDVYAFGLILFEMATGRRAFPSDNFLSGIAQRLTGPAPDPKALVPSLPDSWQHAIAGCLRIEPGERFASGTDVVAVIDGGRARLPRPARHRASSSRQGPRKFRLLAACALAAMALLAGSFRLYRQRADSKVSPGALVYLTEVRNETGEKALDNLTELIRAGLAQSVQVNLLDKGRVGDILQQMTKAPDTTINASTAREIAMRAGAVRVIFATVTESSGSYRLDVDVQQPDNTPVRYRNHWAQTFTWRSAPIVQSATIAPEILTTVRSTSDWIRHVAGESSNDIARLDVPPEDVTTSSWQALAEFIDAEGLALEHRAEAVVLLQQAVKVDPQFALAYARMGDLLFALNRTEEGYQAYSRALDEDLASRLTRRERDFIKGTFAVDTRDFSSAEEAFRDCSIYYETDALCIYFRALPLRMLGRSHEALDALKHSLELASSFTGAYQSETYDYILLGDLEDAAAATGRLRDAGHAEQAALLTGDVAFLRHDFAAAQAAFVSAESAQVNQDWSMAYALLARLAAERGQYDLALQYLAEGIEQARFHRDRESVAARLLDRAYIESREGDLRECLHDSDASLEIDSNPAAVIRVSAAFGYLAAKKPASAAVLANQLRALQSRIPASATGVIFDLARYRVHGEWLLAIGEPAAAFAQFEKAGNLDSAITGREYLARSLAVLAAKQPNAAAAHTLRENAFSFYERISLHPEAVWFCPEWSPPGLFADEMEDALRLGAAGPHPNDLTVLKQAYFLIRPTLLSPNRLD